MLPREILKKVRRIQIFTTRMVQDVFAGEYQSVFKGRGMEFEEVREYHVQEKITALARYDGANPEQVMHRLLLNGSSRE